MRKSIGILLVYMVLVISFFVVFNVESAKADGYTFYPSDDTCIDKYNSDIPMADNVSILA